MKRHVLLNLVLAFGLLAVTVLVPVGQTAQAQWKNIQGLGSTDHIPSGWANGRLDSGHSGCVSRCSGRSQQRQ